MTNFRLDSDHTKTKQICRTENFES